ncbi:MAG: energy transducer TonB, partial [Gillisia sp.]
MKKLILGAAVFFFTGLGFAQEGVTVSGNTISVKEIAPVWPACEKSNASSNDCFNQMVAKHIKENYKFPRDKDGEFIRGKTVVSFFIDEKGEVSNVAAEGSKKEINQEAMRIVKLFPKMTP